MILGPVSLIDCAVFLIFLAPQLLIQVGIFRTIFVALQALPFILVKLPLQLVGHRYFTGSESQHKFIQEATLFEDLVVRCVKYAFAGIPTSVGKVFFSQWVSRPFLRWRMLRHGYLTSPIHYQEYAYGEGQDRFNGIWIKHRPDQPPDMVLYYVHGGGFALGSAYFYLEFLLVWHSLLRGTGYQNPAIFALEYTLVPEGVYPRQVDQVMQGYSRVLDVARDPAKVCVAGDSAGGALILSLLQELGAQATGQTKVPVRGAVRAGLTGPRTAALPLPLPRMATLISPWVTLMTNLHYPSSVDYLDRQTLWKYAHEYAGVAMINQHPASPGSCTDDKLWRAASPERGIYVIYGEEEVFAPDIEAFLKRQERIGTEVRAERIEGGIHAWPVASLFLSSTEERRLYGLRSIVSEMKRRSVGQMDGKKRRSQKSD